MAIYARFKDTGYYLCDCNGGFYSVPDIADATDMSDVADILADSDIFELVEIKEV